MASKKLPPGLVKKVLVSQFGNINKSFWKELANLNIARIITDFIQKGISPVDIRGATARFQKYSKSYIDQIKGKAAFFKKNGKTIAVSPLSNKELDAYRASKQAKKTNKNSADFVKSVTKSKFGGKKVSPVSLKLSGKMLDSLTFNRGNGILNAADEKWQYHNGEDGDRAPNMPERRLLPDRPGEGFNRRIQQNITEALAKALGLKGSRVKKFMRIRFNIKS